MRISLVPILAVAALGLFVFYLYAPTHFFSFGSEDNMLGAGSPVTNTGWDRLQATYHVEDFTWVLFAINTGNLADLGPHLLDAFFEGLLALGYVGLCQLPYLSSRHVPPTRWRKGCAALLAVCALASLYEVCSWDKYEHLETFGTIMERRYGAWLPPAFFTLAAAAVFMRMRQSSLGFSPKKEDAPLV
jgi:hypothetical protein